MRVLRQLLSSTRTLHHKFPQYRILSSTNKLSIDSLVYRTMATSNQSGTRAETDAFGPIDVENKYYWGMSV